MVSHVIGICQQNAMDRCLLGIRYSGGDLIICGELWLHLISDANLHYRMYSRNALRKWLFHVNKIKTIDKANNITRFKNTGKMIGSKQMQINNK